MNKNRVIRHFKKAFILSFLFIAVSNTLKSQDNSNTIVPVIGDFTPTISDAFKINENPKITDTTVEKLNLTYSVIPKLFQTTFNVDPIKPAKITGDPLAKLYKTYIKAGFGSKISPLLEFYFNNLRATEESIGIYYRHFSSAGKIKDYAYPGFSENEASIYAGKFYKYHSLTGKVNYNRDVIHYYGFPDTLQENSGIEKDSIKQIFSKYGGQIKFKSTYKDSSRLNHSFLLRYSYLSDNYFAKEHNILFTGAIDKNVRFFGRSVDYQDLGLNLNVDFYNDVNKIDTGSGTATHLLPHFSAKIDVMRFDVGWNVFLETTDDSKITLFPEANISVDLYDNVFVIYAGITGEHKRNSIGSFAKENPFINTSLPLAFTSTKSKFSGGFKGSLSSNLSFNAYISESKIEKLPLYVTETNTKLISFNDSLFQNKFTVIYDDATIFNTHLEIAYQKSDKYKAMLISNYYQYSMTDEQYAWHKPNMDMKFAFSYNLRNKILLKIDAFAFGNSKAKRFNSAIDPTINPKTLKGKVDVNLGLEYRYSKILSGFLNINNIGAAKYKRYYDYPTYGFNVMIGLTYAL